MPEGQFKTRAEFEAFINQRLPDSPVKGRMRDQLLRQWDEQTGYGGLEQQYREQIEAPNKSLPFFDFLSKYLQGSIETGLPYKDALLQTSTGAVNKAYDLGSRRIGNLLSGRGLGKSGIAITAQQGIESGRAGALNEATNNLNVQDINYRQNAILRLLGLSQMESTYGLQQNQQRLGALGSLYGFQQQNNQFQQQLAAQEDAQQMQFWGRLLGAVGGDIGSLLSMGSGGGSSGSSGSPGVFSANWNPSQYIDPNDAINRPLPF